MGVCVFWPLLLYIYVTTKPREPERNAFICFVCLSVYRIGIQTFFLRFVSRLWHFRIRIQYTNTVADVPPCSAQQTQNICITFIQRRPNVFDAGPTLYKCYTNVSRLLGDWLFKCPRSTLWEQLGAYVISIDYFRILLQPTGGVGHVSCWGYIMFLDALKPFTANHDYYMFYSFYHQVK